MTTDTTPDAPLRPDLEAAVRDQLAPRHDYQPITAWIVAQTRKETRA